MRTELIYGMSMCPNIQNSRPNYVGGQHNKHAIWGIFCLPLGLRE